mmetsp:Transcript_27318/g.45560  ORF Transcript_27318/g.45560 Transcript_27318/m.45560 type:complete len:211 (-) Transcript_27318:513-1145(-)
MICYVVVGSKNPVKINSVRAAFVRAFPDTSFEFEGIDAASGVPDQPWGDSETRQGAINRALACSSSFSASKGVPPDYAVGLEGGVEEDDAASKHPGAAGLQCTVNCFAWMAVLKPAPEGAVPRWGLARTASFQLPPPIVALMLGSEGSSPMELGSADDAVFHDENSKQKGGTVGKVTRGLVDRTAYYEHALHMALCPFMHDETGIYLAPQ